MYQKLIQAFPALTKNDIRSRNEEYVFRVDIVKCNSYNTTFISVQFYYGIWETGYACCIVTKCIVNADTYFVGVFGNIRLPANDMSEAHYIVKFILLYIKRFIVFAIYVIFHCCIPLPLIFIFYVFIRSWNISLTAKNKVFGRSGYTLLY